MSFRLYKCVWESVRKFILIIKFSWTTKASECSLSKSASTVSPRTFWLLSGNRATWTSPADWISLLADRFSLGSLICNTLRSLTGSTSTTPVRHERERCAYSWRPSSTNAVCPSCSETRGYSSLNWTNSLWTVSKGKSFT